MHTVAIVTPKMTSLHCN